MGMEKNLLKCQGGLDLTSRDIFTSNRNRSRSRRRRTFAFWLFSGESGDGFPKFGRFASVKGVDVQMSQ